MATRIASLAGLASLLSVEAFAETAPLSAIDWLSNSVREEAEAPSVPSTGQPLHQSAKLPDAVTVTSLDAPVPDSVGVIDADALGLPVDVWGRSSAADLSAALSRVTFGDGTPPAIHRFLADMLQARLSAPIDAAVNDAFFFARIDRLLEKGHLDEASDLIRQAGLEDPQLFRRQFDIALLLGRETESCREIEATPEFSPTYPARIFCLARLGQFDVAALTLGNAETLGILTEREDALLLHFLDPELFEGEPIPPAPAVPTPLQFRLYEAVGERIATDRLPLPFAFADMSDTVGWKARLNAAERLAASGAIPFERLLEVYEERAASASGGVWERVVAFQALSGARRENDDDAVLTHLPKAWAAARDAGYEAAFARWIVPTLRRVEEPGGAMHLAFEIALLAEDVELAAQFANSSTEDQFLLSIAANRVGTQPAGDAFGRAIIRGLSSVNAGPAFEALIADDRRGEALFRALDQLAEGATGNPDTTAQSLAALRRIGLQDLARQIAVELVLIEGAA